MANYYPRRIQPADSLVFDAAGKLAGIRSGVSGDQTVYGLNSTEYPALQSLLSGGGIGPSSTFASLHSAAANAGMSYRVTDVGPVGCGSIWIDDGTRLRTLGGQQLHCSAYGTLAAPLATLSAVGKLALPAGDRVTAGSILLPVGLPQIGQGVKVVANIVHRGTAGAWNFLAKIGTTNTTADNGYGQTSGTSGQDSVRMDGNMYVATATTFIASLFSTPNQATSGGQVLRNSNFNNAAQLYLTFSSSSLTAGDFLDLLSYEIYLLG